MTPACHPDRRHMARGLCDQCYMADYAKRNTSRLNGIKARWLAKNPEKRVAARRKYNYGAESEKFHGLYPQQDGRCAICRVKLGASGKATHVDHDHADGHVRGLLCARCNIGLGQFGDDPAALDRAAEYLEANVAVTVVA